MQIFLAPIQGFTDYVFRDAHSRMFSGVSKYFTPFMRVENGEIRKKDIVDLIAGNKLDIPDKELVPQIIANSREDVLRLVECIVSQGFKSCDVNFGCPFPQQSKKMRGCGILQSPDSVAEVLETLREFPEVNFSLKMRLGYSEAAESLAVVDVINNTPLRFVTIHPRLGKQMYTGNVDMPGFQKLMNVIKHPVVYNGDIRTWKDVERISSEYPNLHAVMIGRGLIANPFLAEGGVFDKSRFLKFLQAMAEGYLKQYQGSEFMVSDKLKTFFTYSDFDKKNQKAIQKSQSIQQLISNVAIAIR